MQLETLVTQYYDQIVGLSEVLSQSIFGNWAVSQELRDAALKGRVDSRAQVKS